MKLDERPTRESLIGSFCALLELVKLGLVQVAQDDKQSDIKIRLRPEHEVDIESIVQSSIFDDEALEESEASDAHGGQAAGVHAREADDVHAPETDDAHARVLVESGPDEDAERAEAARSLVLLPSLGLRPKAVHAETEPG